jgi:single-stranded DNA-specific DHH superfamily exonuclease
MTYYGLKRLNYNPNVGLKSIIKICGLQGKEITISDVIFKIGPRINASGRMQSGMEAVELLVTRDIHEAFEKGKNIDQYNKDRKELDKRITEEASAILADRGEIVSSKKPIVIYNKDWHKGIIGIVASRMTELYCKPCVVLTLSNGLATGSSRSVQGFDIYKAIESTRDLLDNFGGHTYAVGLSLKEENIPEFTRRFEQYVIENIQYVQDVINDCLRRDVKVILLTIPTYKSYFELLDTNQLTEMEEVCKMFAEQYENVEYLNYLKHSDFTEEDFYDADHLNEYGAEKLTKMLDEYIMNWQ